MLHTAPLRARTLWACVLSAALHTASARAEDRPVVEHPVQVGDREVFRLRRGRGDLDAAARARAATKALGRALVSEGDGEAVRVESHPGTATIYLGKTRVVDLDAEDAKLAGVDSVGAHAESIAASVREGVGAERKRKGIAKTVFSLSLVVFLGLVALYLLRKLGELSSRGREFLERHPQRVPAVRLQSIELVSPGVLGGSLRVGLSVGQWIGQLGVVYTWLVVVLSMFERTRGYTDRLTGIIVSPLAGLMGRIAAALPVMVVAAAAALALYLLLRFVGLFFQGVASGQTRADWLPAELAPATSILVRGAILLAALLFLAPVVTGSPQGAFSRAGFVAVAAVALACTPLLASTVAGAIAVYGKRLRLGDHLAVGQHRGKLQSLDLICLTIRTRDGEQVRVPHLRTLYEPLILADTDGPWRLPVVLPLSRAPEGLVDALQRVVAEHDAAGVVELVAIRAESAEFDVQVVLAPPARLALARALVALAQGTGSHPDGASA